MNRISISFTKNDVQDLLTYYQSNNENSAQTTIDPVTEKNLDRLFYFLDTAAIDNDFGEIFFQNLEKALKNFNPSQESIPLEQLSQKIDIFKTAFTNTLRLAKIYLSRESEEKYANLIQDMHVPQTDEMIVNLVWLKKEKDTDPKGLVIPKDYKRLKVEKQDTKTINILKRLDAWASEFPIVFLWYDGTLLSEGSVERTQAEIQKNCVYPQKIQLKDIRTLKTVQDNEAIFNHSDFITLSPYVKSNLLRVAISYEQATMQPSGQPPYIYSIYADMSIPPFLPELISENPEAIYDLNTYGFVMSYNARLGYENNFHIFSNMNQHALDALKIVEIDFNLRCINDFLTKMPPYNNAIKIDDEIAWANFVNVGMAFRSLSSKANWTLNGREFKDAIEDPSFNPYAWFIPVMVEEHDKKALSKYLRGAKTYPAFLMTDLEWEKLHPEIPSFFYSSALPTLDVFAPKTSSHGNVRKRWNAVA